MTLSSDKLLVLVKIISSDFFVEKQVLTSVVLGCSIISPGILDPDGKVLTIASVETHFGATIL